MPEGLVGGTLGGEEQKPDVERPETLVEVPLHGAAQLSRPASWRLRREEERLCAASIGAS
jgi:hypothetical protein